MKKKYIFSDEDIQLEFEHVEKLRRENKLESTSIPDRQCVGTSDKNRKTNQLLAIFGGIFALDRFYVGKTISAVVKLSFCFIIPLILGLLTGLTAAIENYGTDMLMYWILVCIVAVPFYFTDIYYAFIKPSDNQNRCLESGEK